jgi:RNA recognition motif-containing protein
MMTEESNKLYVGNLAYSIGDEQLSQIFSEVEGVKVTEARVITDRVTGKPRGFGFVTVENNEMAQKAIEAMNEKEVEGRKIIVNIARPQRKDRRRY